MEAPSPLIPFSVSQRIKANWLPIKLDKEDIAQLVNVVSLASLFLNSVMLGLLTLAIQ